jgi:hypothetical protein
MQAGPGPWCAPSLSPSRFRIQKFAKQVAPSVTVGKGMKPCAGDSNLPRKTHFGQQEKAPQIIRRPV